MTSKRSSRKRRKERREGGRAAQPARGGAARAEARTAAAGAQARAAEAQADAATPTGYARSRVKDARARAALKPLRPGERPTAVTVGAVAATLLAIANLVALAFGYNASEDTLSPGSELTGSILTTLVVGIVAYGMWKARYWGVLGMQTLLGLTLVVASLALLFADNWWGALLLLIIIASAGTLFWFLVKAMARIQMPQRPGR